jgi:Uma2 family endonuclease
VDTLPPMQNGSTQPELLEVPDGYELVDGRLVEKKMGMRSNIVAGNLYALLRSHVIQNDLGWAIPPDSTFRMQGAQTARKPDAAFVRKGRLDDDYPPDGECLIAPDLAAETISPNDYANEVNVKTEEYLAVGVRLVWVIDLEARVCYVHRADGSMAKVRQDGDLDGEDVVPGFRCRLSEVLLPPAPPKPKKKGKGTKEA